MRVVLDTNVLISALLIETSLPAQLITQWRRGRFDLLTADLQLEELMRVTRYPKISARLKPSLAGRLINHLRELAVLIDSLPPVEVSPDPDDNDVLSIAFGGAADYRSPAINRTCSRWHVTKARRLCPCATSSR
ncbi:putative toxin-antitoxin system toxin component, PIN family [Methylomicrobium sp. Wu6]|uniref:putative toxin-antitoxin system toxin component, PIN family n=1 Tax=Methylomicrobium sp. Wu6 TaxID=3107928 RepID=UPI002DD6A0EF|nr:putative toxin-antitoxin system toxin component, PIN family [Methylomicrobium sp. Wu6]MEC4748579.1 putative toxin-antitoxin system toxin component, PIN family [Methylomicrobium sp. Wu6]